MWSLNSTLYGVFQPISTTKMDSIWTFNPSIGNVTELLETGKAYYNVHTKAYTNGEIRGQFAGVPLRQGGGGAVVYDQTLNIPIDLLSDSIDIRILCDIKRDTAASIPKLTCDLSLPEVKDAAGKPLMMSVNTELLWDVAMGGIDALKGLIDLIITALGSLGK